MSMFKRWREARDQRREERFAADGTGSGTKSESFRSAVRRGATKGLNRRTGGRTQ